MWCSTCQHDVPPAAATGAEPVRCQQCGTTLGYEAAATATCEHAPPLAAVSVPDEDWQIEAEIRSAQRMVERLRSTRIDQPAAVAAPHVSLTSQSTPEFASPAAALPPKGNLAAWTLVSLGLGLLACGGVLVGWSLIAGRDDLWPIGLPLALAGQAGLIVGLVFQLEGLWQSNRQTAQTLTALDGELARVRLESTQLRTAGSTPSHSLQSHLAETTTPHILLADVKGQLDRLAQQLARAR